MVSEFFFLLMAQLVSWQLELVLTLPGLSDGGVLVEDDGVALGVLGEEAVAVDEGDGPVDQVELQRRALTNQFPTEFFLFVNWAISVTYIKVVGAKLLESIVERSGDVLGLVAVVPEL